MKTLTRIFFCIFAVASFYSCEPEELEISSKSETDLDYYSETGDQEDVKDDKEG